MKYSPKYKTGDKVMINPKLSGKFSNVALNMIDYKGMYVTIAYTTDTRIDSCYRIKEDGGHYAWGDNMILHSEQDYEIY